MPLGNLQMSPTIRISALLLLVATLPSCDSVFGPSNKDSSVVFRSSFETEESFEVWNGYAITQYDEPCPSGGMHSAQVSGGCIIPHAYIYLPASNRDRYLSISFWARLLGNGGSVDFSIIDTASSQSFAINDTTWTLFQTNEALFCPANHIPRIQMLSGGIVYGAMLVDLMVVEKVR